MNIYINTVNKDKVKEIQYIFSKHPEFSVSFLSKNIVEVLSNKIEEVIRQKAVDAYINWKLPVIIEHGALSIKYFNGFPGALSKPMWDLVNSKICDLIPPRKSRAATVISAVCFCDGKRIQSFIGETTGVIAKAAKGNNGFQFDPIFIPNGSKKTYAEMDFEEKMRYSQATKAYNELIAFFKK